MSASSSSRRLFVSCVNYFKRNSGNILGSSKQSTTKCPSSYTNHWCLSQYFSKPSKIFVAFFGTSVLCGSYVCKFHEHLLSGIKRLGFHHTVEAAETFDDERPRSQQFNFVADVVEKAGPSVVFIESKGRHPMSRGTIVTESNGSGFIVRDDGLILTNAHVVANKEWVIVKLQNGQQFQGKVEAVDQITDLATVKINATNLPALKLGKSSNVRPGEWVIAMGSPLSLSNTVTCGIVSSVHRGSKELGLHNRDMAYIQTDAVINFGNSGGPLVNLDGEAIGINTMKVTTGISFAIPSDIAAEFLRKAEELLKRKESRGWFGLGKGETKKRRYMGITMLTLTPSIIMELQERVLDFPDHVEKGVLVQKLIIGSPAHHAGMQPGDIIVKINDHDVTTATDVYRAMESGEVLRINIVRRNKTLLVSVVPEEVE